MSEIAQKDFTCILNMLDSINKIEEYTSKFENADDFYNDRIVFDATMMNFVVIGEMVDKITEKLIEDSSKEINWIKVKGFRNIIAHNYFGIDAEEVWQIICNKLPELKSKIEKLIQ
ncbi:MAG: DUF86 domain-containing protein [Bacteroidales bacterium]|nr:DUF86 domain-containing protein [Bacteroidales bacterium]